MTRSRAYEKHPQHKIEIDEERVGIRVTLDGEVLAETTRGLSLRETHCSAVVYIPRDDVRMDRLRRSDLSTHCPFKGDAHYFEQASASESRQELAWSYESPFDQMAEIRGHVAFYSDRTTLEPLMD